ncbi:MAG: hypothetical protein AAGF50_12985 [Pseudomonadota bacterium]
MRGESDYKEADLAAAITGFCLTNMSVKALVACAVATSALLWLCILAVL